MKRTHLIGITLMAALTASGTAMAKSLSPDEALRRVQEGNQASGMKKKPSSAYMTLAHTFASADSAAPMIYVFNDSRKGYVVASADDSFPALIGYGNKGRFNVDSVPPAMRDFIADYAAEMEYLLENCADEVKRSAIASPAWQPIAPLLTSKWDQGNPYNLYSPIMEVIDSSGAPTGESYSTVTGCVATSLAQVLYYHKWPDVGTGKNSYEWNTGYSNIAKKTLSYDFSAKPFDWDNMLDSYNYGSDGVPSWTEEQAAAVAELMYACGISVNMSYNADFAGGSGAVSRQQAAALVNYFKYSRDVRYQYRDYCTSLEFEKIIYDNLQQGLPVLYNGRGSAGGHSFVCDGYAGNHYFHFNWGWSGDSDGYFYLARLNPESLGIGGGAGGFNSMQGISYNIRPVRNGEDSGVAETPYFYCVGDFDFSSRAESTAANGQKLMFTRFVVNNPTSGYNGGFWNFSTVPFTGYLGVAVEDQSGEIGFVPAVQVNGCAANAGYTAINAYLEEFGEGVYKIYPAYYDLENENSDFIRVANGYRDHVTMTVLADGTRSFANATPEEDLTEAPELAVTCFNYAGKIYTNTSHDFLLSVANHTADRDYYGDLTMVLKDSKGRVRATMPLGKYDIPAGLTIPYSFSLTLDVLKQDYTISFRDSYGRDLPGEYPLSVSETGKSLTTQLRIMSFTPNDIEPDSAADRVTFQVGNYGSTAVAAPAFQIAWFKLGESSGQGVAFSYPNLTIEAQRIYSLSVSSVPFNLEEGDYEVRIYWLTPDESETSGVKRTLISNPIALRSGFPVNEVKVASPVIEMSIGETRKVETQLSPENATFRFLSWVSSNPGVATVDNEGNITATGAGRAYVSATAHNGANDICEISVSGTSGTSIEAETPARIISVYSISGTQILDNPDADAINSLPSGVYMMQTSRGTRKLIR